MATTLPVPAYPFDPTGSAATNRVTNEQHQLTASNYRDYQLIIPRYAPFFQTGLKLKLRDLANNVRDLVFGIDYYLSHEFQSASKSTAKRIYGSIYFLKRDLVGTVMIESYQTIGGDWNIDEQKILEILSDRSHNPMITTWEQVNDLPVYFPPTAHQYNIYDQVNMSDYRNALGDIERAILAKGDGAMQEHIDNHNNPHQTNKGHVGLGNVDNFKTATSAQTAAGNATNLFVTPAGVRLAITNQIKNDFDAHVAARNPHGTNYSDVGAPSVQQMNDGLDTKLGKTESAVDSEKFNGRTYAETKADILTGTAANSLKLGNKTIAQLTADILTGTAANSLKLENYTLDEIKSQIQQMVLDMDILNGTAANSILFNGRSFAAATTEILAGTAANSTKFAGMTVSDFEQFIVDYIENMTEFPATATNTLRFDGRTFAQASAEILGGKAFDSFRFDGMTPDQYDIHILDMISSLPSLPTTADNALKLDGKTYQQILQDLSTASVNNALMFNGKTEEQWLTNIKLQRVADTDMFDGSTPEEFCERVVAYHVNKHAAPVWIQNRVNKTTNWYEPIGSSFVESANTNLGLPSLHRITIFGDPTKNEPAVSTYYYYHQGNSLGLWVHDGNRTDAAIAFGRSISSTDTEIDGVAVKRVDFYVLLAAGNRVIKSERLAGYNVLTTPPAGSTAAPESFTQSTHTPGLMRGTSSSSGEVTVNSFNYAPSSLTIGETEACYTLLGYHYKTGGTTGIPYRGNAEFTVYFGGDAQGSDGGRTFKVLSNYRIDDDEFEIHPFCNDFGNERDYFKIQTRRESSSLDGVATERISIYLQSVGKPNDISITLSGGGGQLPLAPIQSKTKPANTEQVDIYFPDLSTSLKTMYFETPFSPGQTRTWDLTDERAIYKVRVRDPDDTSKWHEATSLVSIVSTGTTVILTNETSNSIYVRLDCIVP